MKPFGDHCGYEHTRAALVLEASDSPVLAVWGQVQSWFQKPLLVLGECISSGLLRCAVVVIFMRTICWVSKHTTQKEAPN